jgi:hypothetical protein
MIVKLYRKYISKAIRDRIYKAFLGDLLLFFRNLNEKMNCQCIFIFRKILPDTPENKLYAFMGKYRVSPFPYEFALKYKTLSIDCFWDDTCELYYVIHESKRLYFPFSKQLSVESAYRQLIIEQDIMSPHRYVEDTNRLTGKTVLDIGAAEGIFSLSVIEKANHVYLFECDESWIKALNATFAPWPEKVTIIPMYVSDTNDEVNITIDHFLEGKSKNNLFLKMDIEGYEQAALKGAAKTLKEAPDIDFSICTYHRENDEAEIKSTRQSYHFDLEQTEGFLYYAGDFRRAIVRRK